MATQSEVTDGIRVLSLVGHHRPPGPAPRGPEDKGDGGGDCAGSVQAQRPEAMFTVAKAEKQEKVIPPCHLTWVGVGREGPRRV